MDIKRLGVWTFTDGETAAEAADLARQVEGWGYGALWYAEALGRNSFAHASWLLSNTKTLVIATGIANIYARDAQATVAARHTLNEQSGGRFLLGLGVSHKPLVADARGHDYSKPLSYMRQYLEAMKQAKYMAPNPPNDSEVVLAALGPAMLKLSADAADGAHPYNVTPEHTRQAREILGPKKRLYVEQKVILDTDGERARKISRDYLGMYMKLPNYVNNLLTLGSSQEDIDSMSDRLIDGLVAWGDESALRQRIQEHWDAGADHVCIQPLGDRKVLEALAPSKAA